MLKLFRRLESGINPDLEVTRFLTEMRFPNIAALAGFVAYRTHEGDPTARRASPSSSSRTRATCGR